MAVGIQNGLHQSSVTTGLFSRSSVKDYVIVLSGFGIVIALHYLFLGNASFGFGPGGPPGGGLPPQLPGGNPQLQPPGTFGSYWPIWEMLAIPTIGEATLALSVLLVISLAVAAVYRHTHGSMSFPMVALVGVIAIVLTNLIHGWYTGFVTPIGGALELLVDLPKVISPIDFISRYASLQPTLSVHASTQPPGAVLTIYFLSLLFGSADMIALGLAVIAGLGSAFFIRGIFTKLFDSETAKYAVLLYLLLPAVQVYYLANIYAIVATIAFGTLYFYLHTNRAISYVGTTTCLFLGTFISFLFVSIPLMLLLYELLRFFHQGSISGMKESVLHFGVSLQKLIVIGVGLVLVYGLLWSVLGFNYISAFLYASSLENPNGFMLFSNPAQYISTRLENVMDILVFFGPVLVALSYRGFQYLRADADETGGGFRKRLLVIAALVALGLLFLTGAPKKGETARICMFILPFLIIPAIEKIRRDDFSERDKLLLLLIVFTQAVVIQLVGFYVS